MALPQGYELYDCNAEFRQYWMRQKLEETDGVLYEDLKRNKFPFMVRI